jgi:uracil-DNA glycosylase
MPDQKVIKSLPVIIKRLHTQYPNARYELDWETPLQLLVGTVLAAQCTDERVNQVTPALFKKYPNAKALADADRTALEEDLKPTGFYREKARKVQEIAKALVENHGGEVPKDMDALTELEGVGRKSANVVLTNAFQLPTGIIVDTHVQRVSQRMGLTDQKKPEKIEVDLMGVVPQKEWIFFGPAMVLLGRYTCTWHSPDCEGCVMNDICPKIGVGDSEAESEAEDGPNVEQAPESVEEQPEMATKKAKPAAKSKTAKSKSAEPKAKPASKKKTAEVSKGPEVSVPPLRDSIPADWQAVLQNELESGSFQKLEKFLALERAAGLVYPPEDEVFSALHATPFGAVKVVILGQDPYHGAGEGHGMAFSVKPGVKIPPSLVNIYKELADDLGCTTVKHGYLAAWANQGVLLLNTILTVKADTPKSHEGQGWEPFTDAIIKQLSARTTPMVFVLWGSKAQEKESLIDGKKHRILKAAHPSPLTGKKFFGSKPFSQCNAALAEFGLSPITWQLPAKAEDSPTAPAALLSQANSVAPVAAPATPTKKAKEVKEPKEAKEVKEPKQAPAVATQNASHTPIPLLGPSVEAALTPSSNKGTHLETLIPATWRAVLADELKKSAFVALDQFLLTERQSKTIYPAENEVFLPLLLTSPKSVRVVMLGSEPWENGDNDGLAFSLREDLEPTEGLAAMFEELTRDLGCRPPVTSSLHEWASQGVLLLNQIWTVREEAPLSHKSQGWEKFTDGILKILSAQKSPIVFCFFAGLEKKRSLIDESIHAVITVPNPEDSPDDFVGCGLFSAINEALISRGHSPIYWQLRYVN